MRVISSFTQSVIVSLFAASAISVFNISNVYAEEEITVAFPDKWMLRIGSYFIDNSNTKFSMNSDLGGIGTTIDYQKDLGGESKDTIPRLDAYYRFNERHRIDFTAFSIDRKGTRTIDINPPLDIGDETYSGETIDSEIRYTLYKLGYQYSFFHSAKVELGVSAGLNITGYDLHFSNSAGTKVASSGITVPLPVFGLRMGYAITPKWSMHYVAESFFIDIEDSFKGALFNYELNTEYKLLKHLAIGAGVARIGLSADIDKGDWDGSVSDSYTGYTLFATFYY